MEQSTTNRTAGRLDVHTHFVPPDLPDLAARTGDGRWPSLSVHDGRGRIMRFGFQIVERKAVLAMEQLRPHGRVSILL